MPHMSKPVATQKRLKELVRYDPDTGHITWAVRRGPRAAGSAWGCRDGAGYVLGMIDRRFHRGHQIAFIYMTGGLPEGDIDHINGNKGDNRWSNLRACSRSENLSNQHALRSDNTSGYRGVCSTPDGKWFAQIQSSGKWQYLGTYSTKLEAALAYDRAAQEMRGEFATLNLPSLAQQSS